MRKSLAGEPIAPRSWIKLYAPSMPTPHEILPFLEKMQEAGIYSNYGPLCRSFEKLIASGINGAEEVYAVAAVNATTALELSLATICNGQLQKGICIVPVWTFVATVHAVVRAGLTPVFLDIDVVSWMLQPETVMEYIAKSGVTPAAVVIVSPFGAPIQIESWDEFSKTCSIPLIFDVAAGADVAQCSKYGLTVLSLHATKPVAAGEGGVVVGLDKGTIDRIRAVANFGLNDLRFAVSYGSNAKLSEYHAAVALASLKRWPQTRANLMRIASMYLDKLASHPGVVFQRGWGTGWLSTSLNIRTPLVVSELAGALAADGIEARSWWNGVMTEHPAFAGFSCGSEINGATFLAKHVIGLPFHVYLSEADVERVCHRILSYLNSIEAAA